MSAPSPAVPVTPGSRFTRILFTIAFALGVIALGARLVRGARTGQMEWLEMALPGAAMLGMGAIIAGPRRRWLYFPLLVASFALLVAFYALPHRVRAAPAGARPAPVAPPAR